MVVEMVYKEEDSIWDNLQGELYHNMKVVSDHISTYQDLDLQSILQSVF